MSETDRFLSLNQTAPLMQIPEMYNTTRGIGKEGDLKGYQIPSTPQYTPRSFKFPSERKKDMIYEISKRSKDPDPTTYSPKPEEVQKKLWNPPNGRFLKDKRMTITEEAMKISSKIPGPSDYMPVPKGKSQSLPKALLGKFEYFLCSKEKDASYFNEILFQAEQTPSSTNYHMKLEERDKAFAKLETRLPVFKYYPLKAKKVVEKSVIGPGYLKDLEANYHKKSLSTATPRYTLNKAKIVRKCEEIANKNKFVPGVGQYKDIDKAYTSFVVEHRTRMPFISKSKDIRFTEDFMKSKTWVPGPGSYELTPGSVSPKKNK